MASGLTSVAAVLEVLSAGWTQGGQGHMLSSPVSDAGKRRQHSHLCVSATPATVGGCRPIAAMLWHLCYQYLSQLD